MSYSSTLHCDHPGCTGHWLISSINRTPTQLRVYAADAGWSFLLRPDNTHAGICPACTRRARRLIDSAEHCTHNGK